MKRARELQSWVDYYAGRLPPRLRQKLENAARVSPEVAKVRDQASELRAAMTDIAESEAPELAWDAIGAKIHWEVSRARREERAPSARSRWPVWGIAGALAMGAVGAFFYLRSTPEASLSAELPPAPAPELAAVAEPLRGRFVFTIGSTQKNGAALSADGFEAHVAAGTRLATSGGQLAVQFEEQSAFRIGRDSEVVLEEFDSREVALRVDGRIDVMVGKRSPGQRFAVLAGGHRIEVRGTAFRVESVGQRVQISCAHGAVWVAPRQGAPLMVRAGQSLAIDGARPGAVVELDDEGLGALSAELELPTVPGWSDQQVSATLVVSAGPEQEVRVDDLAYGRGPMRARVAPGRHHIVVEGAEDRWVDARAGSQVMTRPVAPVSRDKAGSSAVAKRRGQLVSALSGSDSLAQCIRPLAKQDLADGAYVALEIGVNTDGSKSHVNVTDSNLPPRLASCVRNVVYRVPLAEGPRASFRHRIRW